MMPSNRFPRAQVFVARSAAIHVQIFGKRTLYLNVAHRVARKIKAGTTCINTHYYGDPAWPFGAYKLSGGGREMGKEVMEHYTETTSVAAEF
jgi:acyl-CoA reductase-like NAD-dependent aldehyde dehydrogenase